MAAEPIVRAFGEAALLVELGDTALVHALDAAIRVDPPPAVIATVPGIERLLVEFDPLTAEPARLAEIIERRAGAASAIWTDGRHRFIPVVYGDDDGPDLEEVARLTGMSPDAVVTVHAGIELRVRIIGFAPGFAYLGDLPSALDVPRLTAPRTRTPAGSVAIAGRMSGIYPADLPGGWRVIGRTSLTMFDPRRDPPAYLAPGDRVRFERVEPGELARRAGPADDW